MSVRGESTGRARNTTAGVDRKPRWPALGFGVIAVVVLVLAVRAIGVDGTHLARPPSGLAPIGVLGLVAWDGQKDAISRLATSVERLAAGEDDVDLPRDRRDEIGHLSQAVDELAETLADSERRLEAERHRADAVLDAVDDVVLVVGEDGALRRWNECLCEVTGHADAELESMRAIDLVAEADRKQIETAIDDGFETGPTRVDAALETTTGTAGSREFVVRPTADLDGRPTAVITGRDVAERADTDRRPHDRERHAAYTDDILDAVDDIFYVLDDDGYPRRWNERLREVTGYADAEIESMHATEFFASEDREAVAEAIETVVAGGNDRVVVSYLTADGKAIPYEFTASRIEDPDGNPVIAGIGRDVSDRVEKERKLRKRERQLSTLMSNIPGMVYRCQNEPDWPFEFVSKGCTELVGYEPEALVDGDVNWATDVLDERGEDLWETVQRAVAEREPFRATYPIETADGERRWVSEHGRGVFAEDGTLDCLEGVMIDITDRIESERELERTRQLLTQAQRLTNVGAWELDLTAEPPELEWSDGVARIHGVATDVEIDPADAIAFYPRQDRDRVEDALDHAIETGESYDLELQIERSDGERRWVRTIGDPVAKAGEIVAVRGSIQDITDHKERERELERYETIIQALGDPVYTLDEEGYFRFVSDAIEPLTGYEPSELAGEHVSTFMTERDLEDARELVRDLLRTDSAYATLEMALPTDDGDVIEAENHIALLPTDDGSFAGTAGVVRDITDRNKRERELERTTDLLERIERIASVGGWEMDVRAEPRTETWTEELYRLHDVPTHVSPDLELAIGGYHPDDREAVRERIEAAVEAETGYDLEARLQTDAGESRWVRAIGEPIYDADGDLVTYRGSVQDISHRKRRELALESLHDTARGLLQADSATGVADLVVETAAEVLDVDGVGVYLLDDDSNALEPAAVTEGFVDRCNGTPAIPIGADDSVLWHTFVTGTQMVFGDGAAIEHSLLFDTGVDGGLLVPIGDHGVFVFLAPPPTIDEETRRLIETLVATTEAAFDRLESEASLRERDAELEAQNRRLKRQIGITEIIRSIDQSLVRATSREEIERTVCERLADTDDIAFAWIGRMDTTEAGVEPREWAGAAGSYLDTASLLSDERAPEPAVTTALTETSTVVSNVVTGLQTEPWRKTALANDFASCLSVPLSFDEYSYGVLSVYAVEPDTFGELERAVFEELGENIANSINAVQTRQALHADALLELTLEFDESETFLARLARETGATVEYEGVATRSADKTRLFVTTAGAAPEVVESVFDDLVSVVDFRLVSEGDDRCLFEATVTGPSLVSRLLRHGAGLRSVRATGTTIEAVVDVPPTTNVREFVEMLAEWYSSVTLAGRQNVERTMHTREELVSSLFESLTDRQLEVLRTAYFAGFFEWPRTSTGEEVAAMLGVSQPTVNRHLRVGQQRLLTQLFGSEGHTLVGAET
ncbi:PAS domain S-box protein [Halosolutus gelatinilyticus]|uniref:PAS domain S-box protein n=1 Tax=Halosolutus gelatinilyticus TaxID=2931975 RepID=UPI001FF2353C|nr:PAS domain S-box protein [Halosolutus gelatinilyticus]